MEGRFKRTFGSDFLSSPSAFAVDGGQLIVAELRARLTIVLVASAGAPTLVAGTRAAVRWV